MKPTPQMPRPRGAGAAAEKQWDEDYSSEHTLSLAPLQDAAEHLQPAGLYAARALAQLRSIADSASRNLWRAEYALAERVHWKGAR
jgi:hypothetical protein